MHRRGKPPSQRPERKFTPEEQLRRATYLQVALGRQLGEDDEKIRTDIRAAFKEALASSTGGVRVMNLQGHGPTKMLNRSGIFRLVCNEHGLDRSNPWATEHWQESMERALEEALARHDGDFAPRRVPS